MTTKTATPPKKNKKEPKIDDALAAQIAKLVEASVAAVLDKLLDQDLPPQAGARKQGGKKRNKGPAKGPKKQKGERAKPPEREPRESRPPVQMLDAKCNTCGTPRRIPAVLAMTKFDDNGKQIPNYRCDKCIKGGSGAS